MSTNPSDTLTDVTRAALHALLDEVLRVNQQFNLTAIRDPEEAWTRHIEDSLHGLASGLFEGDSNIIDIGTGAGFPGLPLLIARPQLNMTLLESTRKKCDFLRTTSELLELQARVVCERAETIGHHRLHRAKYHLATARAVGSLSEVCELALPLLKVGGSAVLWRGSKTPEEVVACKAAIKMLGGEVCATLPYALPGSDANFHLVVVRKEKSTPEVYPRRPGLPKQKPL